jgi:hypothetical protein
MAELTYVHLGERDAQGRPTRDRSLDTVSGRLIRDPKPTQWDFEIEGIVQRGTISASSAANAPKLDVAAWFLHADVGYTFAGPWKPRLSVEYDRASGDAAGGRFGRFDTILGMRRADLGPSGLYSTVARTNLITPGIRLEATPNPRTEVMMTFHSLWLAAREDAFSSSLVRDPSGRSGSFGGHQLDARLRYRIAPNIRFEGNLALLAKGRFLREAPNAPPGDFTRYVSLNTTFLF